MERGKRMSFEWKGIPEEENFHSGHLACQGCGAALSMRYTMKVIGKNAAVVIPACCWSIIDGAFPTHSLEVPVFHTAFETAAIMATGIKAGLVMRGKEDAIVMAWAGDGGTYDIGIQALSGAAERNEDIIYVCYDNEAYMNTGIQRSSGTPWGAWTTTTPIKHPKDRPKKDIIAIMAAHRIPYIATATIGYPKDFIAKIQKAKGIKGTRFILLLSPCPPGWKSRPEDTVKLSRLAVQSTVFPLLEIRNGTEWYITKQIEKPVPVFEYLKLQGRFRHLTDEQVEQIQKNTTVAYEELLKKSKSL
ncbi:MAG: 2-ketoisovalerate ferredoxin oxidoreductase [Candidatus Cloacimonas sp. 4484_209]|nr:MAG: 2-ketoisovalerate ferredoxin oxidoreductase [Candidatus Cloacimonas sp. 4484_209]